MYREQTHCWLAFGIYATKFVSFDFIFFHNMKSQLFIFSSSSENINEETEINIIGNTFLVSQTLWQPKNKKTKPTKMTIFNDRANDIGIVIEMDDSEISLTKMQTQILKDFLNK
jgi:hypothetical protein